MISILHIGLPLRPPWLTEDESKKISARLAGIRQKMIESGYRYQVLHASPDGGLTEFRERLRAERVDAVLIGGGVAEDPRLAEFKQRIVQAVREGAPKAKVLDFDHAIEVPVLVARAFGKQ
jgi:DNA-binding LacI/PurR family transcriptional regulator